MFFLLCKVWNHYDQDHSGYIESDELKVLLHFTLTMLRVSVWVGVGGWGGWWLGGWVGSVGQWGF